MCESSERQISQCGGAGPCSVRVRIIHPAAGWTPDWYMAYNTRILSLL